AMALAAIAVATVAPPFGDVGRCVVAFVLLVFVLQVAMLPTYERLGSLLPIRRAAYAGCAALLLAALGYGVPARELRAGGLVFCSALAVGLMVRGLRRRRKTQTTMLLVGDRVAVSQLVSQWSRQPEVRIAGICLAETDDDGLPLADTIMDVAVLGGLENVPDVARRLGVDQVVCAPGPVLTGYDVRRLSWALEDTDVELAVAAEVHGAIPARIVPRLVGRRLLLSVRPTRPAPPLAAAKWVFDRVAAAVLLVLIAPLLLALWLLVRWDSPG